MVPASTYNAFGDPKITIYAKWGSRKAVYEGAEDHKNSILVSLRHRNAVYVVAEELFF